MISSFATPKALLDKLTAFATANNIDLAVNGVSYEPSPSVPYLSESYLSNTVEAIGMAQTDSDIERPIYQITVSTPKSQGKWVNLQMVDMLKAEFNKAQFVFNDGKQTAQVNNTSVTGFALQESHGVSIISVNLTVIATNT